MSDFVSAKVVKPFRDKYTKERYVVGQGYKGNIERVEYLQDMGYLADTPKVLLGNVSDHNEYQMLTKKEIEELLTKRGTSFNKRLTKSELIMLLLKE